MYGQRVKACLLALCFILISNVVYLVGLHCIVSRSIASPLGVAFHLPATKALVMFYSILFFVEETCLFGVLFVLLVKAQVNDKQFNVLVLSVSTVFAITSVLCWMFSGNLSASNVRELFLSGFPVADKSISSNQTAPLHAEFILAWTGTLLKAVSWIFVIFLAMAKTFTVSHQDDHAKMHQNRVSDFYSLVRMVVFIVALYCSVSTWDVMVSNMFPDFTHSIYTMYLFIPYLISLAISECIEDSRLTRGVLLSIIAVFIAFFVKNLLDLATTIYYCSSHWTEQCLEWNPVYYSTMVVISIAGITLWICISELSDRNLSSSTDKASDLLVV